MKTDTRGLLASASAAAARTVRISSSVAPECPPVPTTNTVGHSKAAKSGLELAVDRVHLDHDVCGFGGRHPRRAAERGEDAHDPPQPAELRADLLLAGLIEHGNRVRAVDEHQPTDLHGRCAAKRTAIVAP